MTLLLLGLVGGIITGISPCVLPVLPVVFLTGGSAPPESAAARRRPYLVVLGLTLSFAVFTLFGSLLIASLRLPDATIRWVGLVVLVLVGLGLMLPSLGHLAERPFYRFPQRALDTDRGGFWVGVALGAVFVPCAGPVLAAITVAGATGRIGWHTIGLTLGFAVGTALPLLIFAIAGRGMTRHVRLVQKHQRAFRTACGAAVILLAVALTFNLSDIVQREIPDYTKGLVSAEKAVSGHGSGSLAACQDAAETGSSGLSDCGKAPAFTGISHWLNTDGESPTIASLKGKVVLVDFWAYSCINCQRELPHVEAWYRRYHRDGLEVIGVHTPEYAFERVASNVSAGARRLGLTFPVALDNSYGTWNAYDNQSWPAAYLIDAHGRIRHISIGEGDYTGEEQLIRRLLTAAHPGTALPAATNVTDTTPDDPDQSPETYLGSERAQYYSGTTSLADGTRSFTLPKALQAQIFALGGVWTVGKQHLQAGRGAVIALNYHASHVYLDVGGTGSITITGDGATRVIPVHGAPNIRAVVNHASPRSGSVRITLSPGLSAYSFTFG